MSVGLVSFPRRISQRHFTPCVLVLNVFGLQRHIGKRCLKCLGLVLFFLGCVDPNPRHKLQSRQYTYPDGGDDNDDVAPWR